MTFTWPTLLWALAAVPVLLVGGRWMARRQRAAEQRLADPRLWGHLAGLADHRRRVVPAILYTVALTVLIVAMARPIAAIPLPVNRAALVLAIDTSRSMMADDAVPTRLEAAKEVARALARASPRDLPIGLIAFSDVGTILVLPTTDRVLLREALDRLQPQQSTSVGSAVLEGLAVLPGRRDYLGERLARLRAQASQDPLATIPPAPGGRVPALSELPPAAIVILSDGVVNTGVAPRVTAALARESQVKVHTVAFGRDGGAVMNYQGRMIMVPFDPSSLREMAEHTGGEHLRASDAEAARRLGRQLARAIGWERRRTEITAPLAGVAVVLMLAGAGLSLTWFRRVP